MKLNSGIKQRRYVAFSGQTAQSLGFTVASHNTELVT